MKVVYISGPYRAGTEYQVHQNIRRAEEVALRVWDMGAVAICPHLNTRFFGGAYGLPDETWLEGDFELVKRSDALLMVPGWEHSQGALAEVELAEELGIPVFTNPTDLQDFLAERKPDRTWVQVHNIGGGIG